MKGTISHECKSCVLRPNVDVSAKWASSAMPEPLHIVANVHDSAVMLALMRRKSSNVSFLHALIKNFCKSVPLKAVSVASIWLLSALPRF